MLLLLLLLMLVVFIFMKIQHENLENERNSSACSGTNAIWNANNDAVRAFSSVGRRPNRWPSATEHGEWATLINSRSVMFARAQSASCLPKNYSDFFPVSFFLDNFFFFTFCPFSFRLDGQCFVSFVNFPFRTKRLTIRSRVEYAWRCRLVVAHGVRHWFWLSRYCLWRMAGNSSSNLCAGPRNWNSN